MRCWAVYFLAGGDEDPTLYPFECWPHVPGEACDNAVVEDFFVAKVISAPAGASRWWKESTASPQTVSLQASLWNNTSWSLRIWVGGSCGAKSHTGTMNSSSFFGGASAGPGQSIWYELVAVADTSLTFKTSS